MEFIIMDLTEKQQKWILLIPLLIGMILSSINIINFHFGSGNEIISFNIIAIITIVLVSFAGAIVQNEQDKINKEKKSN